VCAGVRLCMCVLVPQEDGWRRGSLAPAMTSVVIEDTRSGALQLLSKGTPTQVRHINPTQR